MPPVSTSLHHLVTLLPSTHDHVRTPEEAGRRFAENQGLVFLGKDEKRRGLLRFDDGTANARELFQSVEFAPANISYFLAIGSARALKSNKLNPSLKHLAEQVTSAGLSPKQKRDAIDKLKPRDNALLLAGIFSSTSGINVNVVYLPENDMPWGHPDRRSHDGYLISGNISDVSRATRAVALVSGDDRTARRDGPERLTNAYSYFGDPWNDEIEMSFRDEYGSPVSGPERRHLPVVSWCRPGHKEYTSHAQKEKHAADWESYGFRLMCDGRSSGPFANLQEVLRSADALTSAMKRGEEIVLPFPSPKDIQIAKQLHAAAYPRNMKTSTVIDEFLSGNGIGVRARENKRATSNVR